MVVVSRCVEVPLFNDMIRNMLKAKKVIGKEHMLTIQRVVDKTTESFGDGNLMKGRKGLCSWRSCYIYKKR